MTINVAYTFDSFVVSESSRLALAAVVAVAEQDEGAGDPLLIYGPIGSGKSHLLHAIAQRLRSRRPDTRILHLSAHAFASRFIDAIRLDELPLFRQSLAALNALLIDDLYVRPHTLKEIVRTAEELSRQGVRVVAASDVAPPQWPGSTAKLGWPDEAARLEIARRIAAAHVIQIDEAALRPLARRTPGSPRKLQSAIARLAAESAVARYAS
jgi:chromosomal replication initiator protein